jgi:hypothetical protein
MVSPFVERMIPVDVESKMAQVEFVWALSGPTLWRVRTGFAGEIASGTRPSGSTGVFEQAGSSHRPPTLSGERGGLRPNSNSRTPKHTRRESSGCNMTFDARLALHGRKGRSPAGPQTTHKALRHPCAPALRPVADQAPESTESMMYRCGGTIF